MVKNKSLIENISCLVRVLRPAEYVDLVMRLRQTGTIGDDDLLKLLSAYNTHSIEGNIVSGPSDHTGDCGD
ncbi:MAG: hypothetical protein WC755_01995 [Candidatus Woesearchaeota archaeon]|jgi:hypothetical protein